MARPKTYCINHPTVKNHARGKCKVCYQQENKVKLAVYAKEKYFTEYKPQKRARDSYLKHTYKISQAYYEDMLHLQQGLCAICHLPPQDGGNLCVDHNHETGAVRDLLCRRCNSVIGFALENSSVLYTAAAYIERHKIVFP